MIPVGPIILLVIFLVRALNKDKSAPDDTKRTIPAPGEGPRQILVIVAWACTVPFAMAFLMLTLDHVPKALATPMAVGFTLSAFLVLFHGPLWASWRIARPLRQAWLSRLLFWWYPPARRFDRRGYARLVAAALGRPMPRPGKTPDPASAWSTCAAALQAERLSDAAHADRLVAALAALPKGARFPRAARAIGIEALCWAAAERGDWEAVKTRARVGRGRGVRLLRLLADAHTSGAIRGALLWSAWLVSPSRRKSLPFLKAALRAERPTVTGPGLPRHPLARREPFGLHLALLAEAAGGRTVPAPEIARLVSGWEAKLDSLDEARLRARGLELGARDPSAAARSLRRSVLDQLAALAVSASGSLPRQDGEAIAAELGQRSRDRLFKALDPFLARSRGEFKDLTSPLQEWEEWLRFREAVEAVEIALGREGMRTAWHGGVRTTAWNWPCKVLNSFDRQGAWASLVMFSWVAELAELTGDDEALSTNRKNVEVARASAADV